MSEKGSVQSGEQMAEGAPGETVLPDAGMTGSARTQFKKGVPQKRGPKTAPGEVPQLLRMMRQVMRQDPRADRTQYLKEVRAWLEKDRRGFMLKLAELEKVFAQEARGKLAGAPDSGRARCEELIEALLEEWGRDGGPPT